MKKILFLEIDFYYRKVGFTTGSNPPRALNPERVKKFSTTSGRWR
jgi:hypothetical protein